jgi:hypothetical protein
MPIGNCDNAKCHNQEKKRQIEASLKLSEICHVGIILWTHSVILNGVLLGARHGGPRPEEGQTQVDGNNTIEYGDEEVLK